MLLSFDFCATCYLLNSICFSSSHLSMLQCVGAIPFGSRVSGQTSMQQAPSLIQVPSRGAMVKGHSISNAAVRQTGAVPGGVVQIAACVRHTGAVPGSVVQIAACVRHTGEVPSSALQLAACFVVFVLTSKVS